MSAKTLVTAAGTGSTSPIYQPRVYPSIVLSLSLSSFFFKTTVRKVYIILLLLQTPSLLPLLIAGASDLNRAATCAQVLAAGGL